MSLWIIVIDRERDKLKWNGNELDLSINSKGNPSDINWSNLKIQSNITKGILILCFLRFTNIHKDYILNIKLLLNFTLISTI